MIFLSNTNVPMTLLPISTVLPPQKMFVPSVPLRLTMCNRLNLCATTLPLHTLLTGANTVQPSSHSPNRFQKCCPPLTPSEISLLNAHKGCRKCGRFYFAHRVPTCPNGFPDGATYVPLTEKMALEAMRKVAVASTYSPFSMPNTASTSRNVSNDLSFTRSNTPQSSSSFS